MKKKILISYYEMMLGGSTTSLLALLNSLDKSKYDIDLQLYKNVGPYINYIPIGVNLLPCACKAKGFWGKIKKYFLFIFSGYLFKAYFQNKKNNKKGFSKQILSDFQVNVLSKKLKKNYDYAIGFLEGWSDRFVAYNVNADKKYCWIHTTLKNFCDFKELEIQWMRLIDNIVFVSENCKNDFDNQISEFKEKTLLIENITDSSLIRKRAEEELKNDDYYSKFCSFQGFKAITVCRLDMKIKGLDRIVKCCRNLVDNNFNFIWYIVGYGEDEATLKEMIEKNGLNNYLILIGARFNPYPFIKSADVMCMPSRFEGKPMVITESMILGTPPIVTEYLSAKEQIKNNIEGLVVDNNDEDILYAVEKIYNNKKLLSEMKNNLLQNEYGNSEYIHEIEKMLFV